MALIIRDVIHGNVHLNELEILIIDHHLFQRLRNISQLGFLKYIFPSANHTRFEHSIGVMHLASEMLQNIAFNQSKLISNKYLSTSENIQSFNKKAFEQINLWKENNSLQQTSNQEYKKVISYLLEDRVIQCLRLAALIHDIGHGPFSHASEILTKNIDYKQILKLPLPQYIHDSFQKQLSENKVVKHECISVIMTTYLFQELNIEKEWLQDVLSLIDRNIEPSKESILKNYNIYHLLRNIISGEIDADRMDYLLRDSYYTGVKYGLFDLNRILSSLYFSINSDNNPSLAIDENSILSFEDYLFRRYQMYLQIYMHRTNLGLEGILQIISKKLDSFTYPLNVEKWIEFNDYNFKEFLERNTKKDSNVIELINNLFNRKSWKLIYEDIDFKNHVNNEFELYIKKLKTKYEKCYSQNFFIHNSTRNLSNFNPTLNPEYKVDIKILKTKILKNEYEFQNIQDNSYLINGMEKAIIIKRIYINSFFYKENKKDIENLIFL